LYKLVENETNLKLPFINVVTEMIIRSNVSFDPLGLIINGHKTMNDANYYKYVVPYECNMNDQKYSDQLINSIDLKKSYVYVMKFNINMSRIDDVFLECTSLDDIEDKYVFITAISENNIIYQGGLLGHKLTCPFLNNELKL
jgi:hypothetical protein